MSNITIKNLVINLNLASNGRSTNSLDSFPAGLMASGNCEATCGDTLSSAPTTSDVPTQQAPSLNSEPVMLAGCVGNSSTGFELTDTRLAGQQIHAGYVANDSYVVFRSDSAIGVAAKEAGIVRSSAFVNVYNKSGNYGRTLHATMAKADQYSDGDAVAVEVYVVDGDDLLEIV